eukprot:TRINITY_DN6142_c0_g1_i10.p1 TRINITY_DN6142_c0_g1~~TRINITY_DN6142_c0_g1_i10.p1  ORF type:complete len:299 (+),score=22.04 TRINITY_DN6142_c0_g1_i10:941-1837(+)
MSNICESNHITDDVVCYTTLFTPLVYGLVEILCLYCSIRSCRETRRSHGSCILGVLYFALHILLLFRIVHAVGLLFESRKSFLTGSKILLGYSGDILALMFMARIFETLDTDVSRERTTYKPWEVLIIVSTLIHTLGYWATTILHQSFPQRMSLVLPIYMIVSLALIELMMVITSVTYIRNFKRHSPRGFNSVRIHIHFLFFFTNLGLIIRICYEALSKIDSINSLLRANPIIGVITLVMTELLPALMLLTYIIKEYSNSKIGMLRIGLVITVEDLIEESEVSDIASHNSGCCYVKCI